MNTTKDEIGKYLHSETCLSQTLNNQKFSIIRTLDKVLKRRKVLLI